MAKKEDSASTAAPATQLEQWREREIESRANQATWRNLSRLDRARLIVELLGDDRLTVRGVTAKITERLGHGAVYDSTTRQALMRLLNEGELCRAPEPNGCGQVRYRFYRNTHLSGPIADLERTFHEPTEDEEAI